MIKNVIVTFNFDTETDSVSNVSCSIDGVEKKKRTTKKVPKETVLEDEAVITLEENKLVLNNKAVLDLGITDENRSDIRVNIKYEKKGKVTFPIIGTDYSFDEEGSGNKITKSNTVAYKGKANTILSEYGSSFKLEKYSEGIFKLLSESGPKETVSETLEALVEKASTYDVGVFTDDDDTTEITDLNTFTL